jgi:hypothetical protein
MAILSRLSDLEPHSDPKGERAIEVTPTAGPSRGNAVRLECRFSLVLAALLLLQGGARPAAARITVGDAGPAIKRLVASTFYF